MPFVILTWKNELIFECDLEVDAREARDSYAEHYKALCFPIGDLRLASIDENRITSDGIHVPKRMDGDVVTLVVGPIALEQLFVRGVRPRRRAL